MATELEAMLGPADKCPRFGKFFDGCRFEARYSFPAFEPTVNVKLLPINGDSTTSVIAAMRPRIYEGDVCVRCGKRAMKASAP